MRSDQRSRSAGEETELDLTVRAGLAVIDVAVACLPYAAEAATDGAIAAGRRLGRPVLGAIRRWLTPGERGRLR